MRFILAASAALALSTAAIAADDIMANYYGNTVVGKSALGQSHTRYRANHTFDAALSNDQGSMETDGTGAAHQVGDSWQITVNGRTSELTLVAGIQ
jgi:opacity protein-like surface antigen